jgi:DNA-binding MarR family transcriptional regulator
LCEIPKKQKRNKAMSLTEYASQSTNRNAVIIAAYQSGGYTLKEVGDFFNLHYSRVSKIVAKNNS